MELTSSAVMGRMKDSPRVPPLYIGNLDDLDYLSSSLEILGNVRGSLGILGILWVRFTKIPFILRGSSYLMDIFGSLRRSLEIFGHLSVPERLPSSTPLIATTILQP